MRRLLPHAIIMVFCCLGCLVLICLLGCSQIQAAFRTDEIRRAQPTPQDEMRYGMSYIHETVWKGVPKFLRRVDTALKNIGIKERLPYSVPLIRFCSWMGGDRDGTFLLTFFTKVAGALCFQLREKRSHLLWLQHMFR